MSSTNGRQARYTVEITGLARTQYLNIVQQAETLGVSEAAITAYQSIILRLAIEPHEFGEPLYDLTKMQMHVLRGTVPPLYIEFGVHYEAPLVVIRRVVWFAQPPR